MAPPVGEKSGALPPLRVAKPVMPDLVYTWVGPRPGLVGRVCVYRSPLRADGPVKVGLKKGKPVRSPAGG